MQNTVVHKARDLSTNERQTLEALLGRAIQEDENISVRAFRGNTIKPAPTGEARQDAFRRLRSRIDETARRVQGVPEEEIDAAIDEAADYVRHNHG
jgi:hypothetical protein